MMICKYLSNIFKDFLEARKPKKRLKLINRRKSGKKKERDPKPRSFYKVSKFTSYQCNVPDF